MLALTSVGTLNMISTLLDWSKLRILHLGMSHMQSIPTRILIPSKIHFCFKDEHLPVYPKPGRSNLSCGCANLSKPRVSLSKAVTVSPVLGTKIWPRFQFASHR